MSPAQQQHRAMLPFLFLSLLTYAFAIQQCTNKNIVVVETELDSPVAEFTWIEDKPNHVYVRTEGGYTWSSGDRGKTWIGLTDNPATELIFEIEYSQADSNHVFFLGQLENSWTTKDGGITFEQVTPTGRDGNHLRLYDVEFHPTEKDWLLGLRRSSACDDPLVTGNCFQELYTSYDMGKTWQFQECYVEQASWGNAGLQGVPKERLYASVYERDSPCDQRQGSQHLKPTESLDFIMSDDHFVTHRTLISGCAGFLITDSYIFATRLDSLSGGLLLLVSDDHGQNFHRTYLPGELPERRYSILDDSEHSIFLQVEHSDLTWGHIYVSDTFGEEYRLSLTHNRRNANGHCDFDKNAALDGFYYANQVQNADRTTGGEQIVATKISYDKGKSWGLLTPPSALADGTRVVCTECNLHLQILHKRLHRPLNFRDEAVVPAGPFLTHDSAPGLVLANGNIGTSLYEEEGSVGTYFSRDGGRSWMQIRNGPHTYEFGDQGGLMLLGALGKETKDVVFSWNQGDTWDECSALQELMHIDDVVSSPDPRDVEFVMSGHRTTSDGRKGVVVHVDFDNFHERECGSVLSSDDFERWSPSESLGGQCLNGEKINYVRRRRNAQCFVKEDLSAFTETAPCECAQEDYECRPGYEPDGMHCVALSDDAMREQQPPSGCHKTYSAPSPYRRRADNNCVGGQDLTLPISHECPAGSDTSSGGNTALIVGICVFVGVGLVVVGGMYVYYLLNPGEFRMRVDNAKEKMIAMTERVKSFSGQAMNVEYARISTMDHDEDDGDDADTSLFE